MVRTRAAAGFAPARAARAIVVMALALALTAACAPRLAQLGADSRAPAIEGNRFITRDGLALGLQRWEAEKPKAIIVALHGMGDYANAFAMPGSWWAKRGITTYAYDQRGFGRSPNKGMWAGSELMSRDFTDFVEVVRARHPGVPTFALGESMGAAVVLSAMASPSPPRVEGVILSAPAVWGWRKLPLTHRVALWLAAHSTPWWSLSGEGLRRVPSDNVEMLRALARDPFYQRRARVDAVYGLVTLMDEAYDAASRVNSPPVLFLYGEKDEIVPREPVQEVARVLDGARVAIYPNGYHMLLRDLQAENVWKDVARWVAANGATATSERHSAALRERLFAEPQSSQRAKAPIAPP
ncbi:MAG: lysophospholipase [Alphaproteobacteria bacterium]